MAVRLPTHYMWAGTCHELGGLRLHGRSNNRSCPHDPLASLSFCSPARGFTISLRRMRYSWMRAGSAYSRSSEASWSPPTSLSLWRPHDSISYRMAREYLHQWGEILDRMITRPPALPPPGTRLHLDTLKRGSRFCARVRWTDPSSRERRSRSVTVDDEFGAREFFELMRASSIHKIDSFISLSDYALSIGGRLKSCGLSHPRLARRARRVGTGAAGTSPDKRAIEQKRAASV